MKAGAGIKSPSPDRMHGALRRMWRGYMVICTAFCTLAALYVLYAFFHERYRYVELPNGVRLVVTKWFELDGGVALMNSNGDILAPANVGGVVWNDHYVKGWRWAPGKDDVVFIYKVGDRAAIESSKATSKEYRALEKQSSLEDEDDFLNYPGFLELIGDPKYHRFWYE